jgi:hypothetical protein
VAGPAADAGEELLAGASRAPFRCRFAAFRLAGRFHRCGFFACRGGDVDRLLFRRAAEVADQQPRHEGDDCDDDECPAL